MEQLSLFENECYAETRPMFLINTSQPYVDNCAKEIIADYCKLEGIRFTDDLLDEDFHYLYNILMVEIRKWNVYKLNDMYNHKITLEFEQYSATVTNSCYLYIDDVNDEDYEEMEDFHSFIDRIPYIIEKYYSLLINEYLSIIKPEVKKLERYDIIKIKNKFYEIYHVNLRLQVYRLRCVKTFNDYLFFEDSKNAKVYSKRKYYWINFFSLKFFSALKDFFIVGFESFNREIRKI